MTTPTRCASGAQLATFLMPKTIIRVIIDDARRLQIGVDDGRSNKVKATRL